MGRRVSCVLLWLPILFHARVFHFLQATNVAMLDALRHVASSTAGIGHDYV